MMNNENYDAKKEWTKSILNRHETMYPSEYVIRIFKGNYPKLKLNEKSFLNKKICDIGCGDGRNLVFLYNCGFDIYGTEIASEIVEKTKSSLKKLNINANIKIGTNDSIKFTDNFFDYLLSWNSCYYMGENTDFNIYVKEYARILKKEGYLILSIPQKTCFIFKDSEHLKNGYKIIRNDPFKIRNGEVLRQFDDEKEIEQTFSPFFKNFIFASINDDCFGYNYHWYLVVCQKI